MLMDSAVRNSNRETRNGLSPLHNSPQCLGPPLGRPEGLGDLMARDWNHLEMSLRACLVVWDLSCVVTWNTHVWSLHMAPLGLPDSVAAGFQECESQESTVEMNGTSVV